MPREAAGHFAHAGLGGRPAEQESGNDPLPPAVSLHRPLLTELQCQLVKEKPLQGPRSIFTALRSNKSITGPLRLAIKQPVALLKAQGHILARRCPPRRQVELSEAAPTTSALAKRESTLLGPFVVFLR